MTQPGLELRSPAGRGLLFATILGSSLAFLDGTVVNVALPHLGRDLDAGVDDLQWTINAYTLPLAAFVLLGGALGDRFGRKRIYLLGVVWFTVASLVCGVAQNVETLIAARALQGIGAALLTPGSLALIEASLRPADRSKAIGTWAGFTSIAGVIGPLVGGWLVDALDWRWVFFLNLPLALVVVVIAIRTVPESRDEQSVKGFDIPGAVLGALGLGGLTYALVRATESGWTTVVVTSLVLGLVGLAAFAAVEMRSPVAMAPPSLFASSQFTWINLVTFVVYAALAGMGFFLVLQLQIVAGFSALAAGAAMAPMPLLLLLGSSKAGEIGGRLGPRWPLAIGSAIAAAATLWLAFSVDADTVYWRDVLPGVLLFGLGVTILVAPLTSSVLAAAPDRLAGVASGVNNAVARAGSLLAVASLPLLVGLSGAEYEQPSAFDSAYTAAMSWTAAALALGAVLAALLVKGNPRTDPPDEAGEEVSPRAGAAG